MERSMMGACPKGTMGISLPPVQWQSVSGHLLYSIRHSRRQVSMSAPRPPQEPQLLQWTFEPEPPRGPGKHLHQVADSQWEKSPQGVACFLSIIPGPWGPGSVPTTGVSDAYQGQGPSAPSQPAGSLPPTGER